MSLRVELGPKSLTVKTTPQTTLASVLEEFCRKYDLDPNEWTLFYKNKELDLSLTYRLSGLVANAKLDVKKRKIDESGIFSFFTILFLK
jgi:tether containing UBX domain for GLUT4